LNINRHHYFKKIEFLDHFSPKTKAFLMKLFTIGEEKSTKKPKNERINQIISKMIKKFIERDKNPLAISFIANKECCSNAKHDEK